MSGCNCPLNKSHSPKWKFTTSRLTCMFTIQTWIFSAHYKTTSKRTNHSKWKHAARHTTGCALGSPQHPYNFLFMNFCSRLGLVTAVYRRQNLIFSHISHWICADKHLALICGTQISRTQKSTDQMRNSNDILQARTSLPTPTAKFHLRSLGCAVAAPCYLACRPLVIISTFLCSSANTCKHCWLLGKYSPFSFVPRDKRTNGRVFFLMMHNKIMELCHRMLWRPKLEFFFS